jgi:hypothetical protein
MSSFPEATFSSGGGAPKMSDLKAPTYEDRSIREAAFSLACAVNDDFDAAVAASASG